VNANTAPAQLALFNVGPAARPEAPDFWTREDEDREDYFAANDSEEV
jgi:hypothetical protein